MNQPPIEGAGGSGSFGSDAQFETSTGTSTASGGVSGSSDFQSQQGSSQGIGAAASELRSDAEQLGSTAADRIHSELDSRKGTAATQVRSVSSAIDRAAGELDQDAPAWLKSTFQQGAQQIQRFADALEQRDSRELVEEVQSFARERPGMFLAACAAAGFAAARVFKAGGEAASRQSMGQQDSGSQPASGDQPMFRMSEPEPSVPASSPGEFV